MNKRRLFRQILGYLIGLTIFVILIPFGLYQVSRAFETSIGEILLPFVGLRLTLANIFVLIGFAFSVGALVAQNRISKGGPLEAFNVEISPKAVRLVVGGPYRYTRNPMLFGTCMYYYGMAIFYNSLAAFTGAALFMALMLIFVKFAEEPQLLREFGEEYDAYRKRVPMFIPRGRKRSV